MKLNTWTIALAAAGIVTIPSLLQADQLTNSVVTALSSTTLSGYVDASAQWNIGQGNANNPPYAFYNGKADGFNLDVVDLALEKVQDDSLWASGYRVELWMGPDANVLSSQSSVASGSSDFAIRQAYVALRTPIGNGINWKLGVWDTIIGYEGLTAGNNPNFTHSYGFTLEPTTHTGLLGTYAISDLVSVTAGIANTFGPKINDRAVGPGTGPYTVGSSTANVNESYKAYMGSIALTAPSDWGWLAGSTLNAGVINGFNAFSAQATGARQTSVYAGTTVATPITGFKLGASMDYVNVHDAREVYGADGSAWAVALYASMQTTEKLTFNLRGEWVDDHADLLRTVSNIAPGTQGAAGGFRAVALTATANYKLWDNVLSRVEFRWDHAESASLFGGNDPTYPTLRNSYILAANLIYSF
jgi:hypothetical protein